MSNSALSLEPARRWRWITAYSVAYLIASAMDLGSTEWALHRPGAAEANLFATDSGIYSALKALAITAFGWAGMAWMFAFGLRHAGQVSAEWLRKPIRSFAAFYLNPWAAKAIGRSPLHMMSYAIAFVVLRVLAAGNNMMIVAGHDGPLGVAVREVGRVTTPILGFVLFIGGFYILLTIALSPLAARLIRYVTLYPGSWRRNNAAPANG